MIKSNFSMSHVLLFFMQRLPFLMECRAAGQTFESVPSKDIPSNCFFFAQWFLKNTCFQINFR